jgi:hypothetical protein
MDGDVEIEEREGKKCEGEESDIKRLKIKTLFHDYAGHFPNSQREFHCHPSFLHFSTPKSGNRFSRKLANILVLHNLPAQKIKTRT